MSSSSSSSSSSAAAAKDSWPPASYDLLVMPLQVVALVDANTAALGINISGSVTVDPLVGLFRFAFVDNRVRCGSDAQVGFYCYASMSFSDFNTIFKKGQLVALSHVCGGLPNSSVVAVAATKKERVITSLDDGTMVDVTDLLELQCPPEKTYEFQGAIDVDGSIIIDARVTGAKQTCLRIETRFDLNKTVEFIRRYYALSQYLANNKKNS